MKGNKSATMAPKKRGSGTKVVTGSTSTVRIGSAKGKLPRTGNGGK